MSSSSDHIADYVAELRGNWRRFEAFAWYDEPEDGVNWAIVYTHHRDSDVLAESNAAAIEKIMAEHYGDDCRQESHNHWAVGWIDGYAIRVLGLDGAPTLAFRAWVEIQLALESYPVLDEDDYNDREQEAANAVWRDCYGPSDRIEYIRRHRDQFEFRGFSDLLGCVRGNYFAGWASELLS